ncbi:Rrf2 family transcriptional regulator [Candidatus Pacearchaeota archaeon]|nr:Rrf2 family transcriptional regulator [Candidatus Pacearchaeota archaeon]
MRLSQAKQEKIAEQILSHLYHVFPDQPFTAEIARDLARDEEFIKKLLFELKDKSLVVSIRKNNKGVPFTRRVRWRLASRVYDIYKTKE